MKVIGMLMVLAPLPLVAKSVIDDVSGEITEKSHVMKIRVLRRW